jgi:hypothetical protein
VVLLHLDLGQQLVLHHLELRPRQRALRLLHFAVVARPRRTGFGVLLPDLLVQVVQLRPAIEGRLNLRLPVEFDQQIARLHGRARLDEAGDYERVGVGAGEPRGRDGGGLHGFNRAAQAN